MKLMRVVVNKYVEGLVCLIGVYFQAANTQKAFDLTFNFINCGLSILQAAGFPRVPVLNETSTDVAVVVLSSTFINRITNGGKIF